jgi:hypothetical protein
MDHRHATLAAMVTAGTRRTQLEGIILKAHDDSVMRQVDAISRGCPPRTGILE